MKQTPPHKIRGNTEIKKTHLLPYNCKEEGTQCQQYNAKLYCWHLEVVFQNIFLDTGKFIGEQAKKTNRIKTTGIPASNRTPYKTMKLMMPMTKKKYNAGTTNMKRTSSNRK